MRHLLTTSNASCGMAFVAAVSLFTCQVRGQSAYFSLEGDLTVAGDQHDFVFDLTRAVGSAEDLRFVTYANAGGTNSAGDIIAAGGIDSVLELFDSGNMQRGFDDNATGGLDSLLSWPGVAVIDLVPLNPDPLPAGGYRLNLREFSNLLTGPWAVDLIGPADAILFSDSAATGASTIDSLKFGTTGFGAAAVYSHQGTLNLLDQLLVAPTGTADLNVNSGTLTVGGLATVNTGGTLAITAGTFTAGSDMTVNGGTLSRNGGSFELASGQMLMAQNGAQLDFTGDFLIDAGTTVDLQSGADLIVSNFLDIGTNITGGSGDGTLIVDGAGTTVTANSNDQNHVWGSGGFTADVTFRNGAMGTLGNVGLAADTGASSTGTFSVESGATVTAGQLTLATAGGTTTTGTVNVDGSGSSLSQTGTVPLTVGHASTGTATINVSGDGTFSSGTGAISVNTTGAINIGTGATGGTFNANGATTVSGGSIDLDDGQLNFTSATLNAGALTVDGGAMSATTVNVNAGSANFNAGQADAVTMTITAGTASLNGGELTAGTIQLFGGGFSFNGGILHVDEFTGNLNNQGGTLAPGGSPGITNVIGNYTNQSSATVQIEIDSAGGVPGIDFDQVNVSAAANLDGSLFADMGFTPAHQDSFQVMTFGSRTGVFSSVTDSGLPDLLVMVPFYTATDLTLSVELLGDASGDGEVGPEDYTLWADNFGIAEPGYDDGDLNRDGLVDAADYTIWANNFGSVVMGPGSGPATVPEPSTFLLSIVGVVGLVCYRRRFGVSKTRLA